MIVPVVLFFPRIYDIHGECVHAWADELWDRGEFEIELRPHGVAGNSRGQIVVSDTRLNNVRIYTPEGQIVHEFGRRGERVEELHLPFYLAVDYNDNIVISDSMNYCVKVFDTNGNFLNKIGGGLEWGKRSFHCPYGVAVDSRGNYLVADHDNNRVVLYSNQGEFMGDLSSKKDGCHRPCGVAFTSGYVAFTEHTRSHSNLKLYQIHYDEMIY